MEVDEDMDPVFLLCNNFLHSPRLKYPEYATDTNNCVHAIC